MTTKEQIAEMKNDINNINEKIDKLDGKMDKIFNRLLDPDTGLIVRVNKNTERLDVRDLNMTKWMDDLEEFNKMKVWKSNVTRAMWVIYGVVVALLSKALFW